MASYPGAKVHRSSRRKLGRGQHTQLPVASVTAAASTTTVTLTFSVPVVVSGTIPLNLGTPETLVSQAQTSPTTVVQHYASSVVGSTWAILSSAPVATFQGGGLASASGTF
jgi:hypothetical protein